ncbi:1-deoxy-D-xylulose-5-phosphate synthase [bacterium]|nr:1-deoxy-D-xylulose-5-phosphate synthase [bacterium]
MALLDGIQSPADLRKLAPADLHQVAAELRHEILSVVAQKGGHLASNLGSVELAVALHYVFDTPDDKLIWDVGHQAYAHKLLTGRRAQFPSIRQTGGISGFTARGESEYDPFGAGHASTSISAALGIAQGLRHKGSKHLAVAVIGDGSLTGGLAFEALNNAGHIPARNLVVILNDNNMSIDPNVGALNSFVNHAVTHPGYNRVRKEVRSLLGTLSHLGVPLSGLASKLRTSVKNFLTPGMLFECFGFRYFGPLNGHDTDDLLETLRFIKADGAQSGPYLVHALTVKGKGYAQAEALPLPYHGVTPFNIETGIQPPTAKKKPNYQDVFAETLIRLAKSDPRVVAVTAAMPSGTGLNLFQKEFPERCYDVGIAEAHAVLFCAGLATEGFRPVAAIYSTFLQRAYDQIIHDVALQKLPVIFAMDRGGLVGADGATHQGAFDLSYLRAIPNMVVMAPKDENELRHMIFTSVQYTDGPIAFRYPRGEVVGVPLDEQLRLIPIGRSELLSADAPEVDVALFGIGYGVQLAAQTQAVLQSKGLRTALINARFAKPIDATALKNWASKARLIVTIEENTVQGGFGSAVSELFTKEGWTTPLLTLGLPDVFIDHGSPQYQRELAGLDPASLSQRVLDRMSSAVETPAYLASRAPTLSSEPVSLQ